MFNGYLTVEGRKIKLGTPFQSKKVLDVIYFVHTIVQSKWGFTGILIVSNVSPYKVKISIKRLDKTKNCLFHMSFYTNLSLMGWLTPLTLIWIWNGFFQGRVVCWDNNLSCNVKLVFQTFKTNYHSEIFYL